MAEVEIDTLKMLDKIVRRQCNYCNREATHTVGISADVLGIIPPIPVCEADLKRLLAQEFPPDIVIPL